MTASFFSLLLGTSALATAQLPIILDDPVVTRVPISDSCVNDPIPVRMAEKRDARDVVLLWNDAALQAIKTEKTPPPVAARNLAVMHIAMFDAMNTIKRTYPPYLIRAAGPPDAPADIAAGSAARRTLTELYPKQARRFKELFASTVEESPDEESAIDWGRRVALTVLDWRSNDLKPTRTSYFSRDEAGRWKPTPSGLRPPLLPEWGRNATFALKTTEPFRPPGPPALDSEEYVRAYLEVKRLGGKDSPDRTDEQTEIARFWEDGPGTVTPPGHWNRIAAVISRERNLNPIDNARLFAMLNVAMAEAALSCWDCKYRFDLWRPVTAIREAGRLEDARLIPDRDWTPLLETPPFPSYTSGHSSFSGAAAASLEAFFGTDKVLFKTTSDGLPGVMRSFARFSDAAKEAGMSRIYGGIHYGFDNVDGLESGAKIGEAVAKTFRERD